MVCKLVLEEMELYLVLGEPCGLFLVLGDGKEVEEGDREQERDRRNKRDSEGPYTGTT